MSKATRQKEIVKILRMQKHEKVENLAFRFGVSTRTINNDILELSIDYPIDTKQGRYDGGVYWDLYNTWQDNKVEEELSLLKSVFGTLNNVNEKVVMKRIINKIAKG